MLARARERSVVIGHGERVSSETFRERERGRGVGSQRESLATKGLDISRFYPKIIENAASLR